MRTFVARPLVGIDAKRQVDVAHWFVRSGVVPEEPPQTDVDGDRGGVSAVSSRLLSTAAPQSSESTLVKEKSMVRKKTAARTAIEAQQFWSFLVELAAAFCRHEKANRGLKPSSGRAKGQVCPC